VSRTALLWAAVVRLALGAVVVLFAGFLYKEHFVVLVLLRPTKEVLLAAGFLVRSGDVDVVPVVAAAVPLLIVAVWHFYLLGALYRDEICDAELPGLAGRLLPPKRIAQLQKALRRRGARLVFAGRLAAFPSSLVAAAAATSDVPFRRFVVADTLGALTSIVAALTAGYVLGEAHERAGLWLTVLGVIVLVGIAVMIGRALQRSGT
jgi:membrane-associated protein